MDHYQKRIEAAFLTACSAQSAYDWLYEHRQCDEPPIFGGDPKAIEFILTRRNSPLIDLGIARFGRSPNAIARVFQRGNIGVRCAALANPLIGPRAFFQPGWLTKTGLKAIVARGTYAELEAIATNPFLAEESIENLLLRKKEFFEIGNSHYLYMLNCLGANPRLSKEYDGPMDGWAEHSHIGVSSIAWGLTKTMEPNKENSITLYRLLSETTHPYDIDNPLEVAARWRIEPDDVDKKRPTAFSYRLRSLIADLSEADESLLNSGDLALRGSFYRRFKPWNFPKWSAFIERDGGFAFEEMLWNDELWKTKSLRNTLRDVAWKVPDPNHHMSAPNAYYATTERYRTNHPEWFEDEDDEYSRDTDAVVRRIEKSLREISLKFGMEDEYLDNTKTIPNIYETLEEAGKSYDQEMVYIADKINDLEFSLKNMPNTEHGEIRQSLDDIKYSIHQVTQNKSVESPSLLTPIWAWAIIAVLVIILFVK